MLTDYVATRWYRAPELLLSWRDYDEKGNNLSKEQLNLPWLLVKSYFILRNETFILCREHIYLFILLILYFCCWLWWIGCSLFVVDVWSVGCIFAELLRRKPFLPGIDSKKLKPEFNLSKKKTNPSLLVDRNSILNIIFLNYSMQLNRVNFRVPWNSNWWRNQ